RAAAGPSTRATGGAKLPAPPAGATMPSLRRKRSCGGSATPVHAPAPLREPVSRRRPPDTVMSMSTIPELLEELRAGRMIILVDDEDRENEGDLVFAAETVTPEKVNFLLRE